MTPSDWVVLVAAVVCALVFIGFTRRMFGDPHHTGRQVKVHTNLNRWTREFKEDE